VYGAQGFSGNLIVPELARDVEVTPVASHRGEPLTASALAGHGAVLNCAGPFAHTWEPIVDACLETGAHYLDICAEWEVFEAIRSRDAEARERGVMLLPGVGFDVVASDCLIAHVHARLPDARRLQLGVSGLELASRGSVRTMLDLVGRPVRVRRGGQIVSEPRVLEAKFDFGQGPKPAYAVSWGDIATAFHTTGIPDIEVYFEATPMASGLAFANRTFGWMFQTPAARRLAESSVRMMQPGPAPHARAGRRAVLVARAEDASGRCVESRLVTPEAYGFTAMSAAAIAKEVLAGRSSPGFRTPSQLLGADWVLDLAGVERTDLG
jgi:short subunit dehydrogenase-like uncharacterized protein